MFGLTALKSKFFKLNRLILFMALTATVITFINSLYSNYQVQKEQLILQAMEVNKAYAKKLSETTDVFLTASLQQLAYSAKKTSVKMNSREALKEEAERLKYQTDTFNSIVISDAKGIAQATSPETLDLVGKKLVSTGSLTILKDRKLSISDPYISSLKNLLLVISAPIFDDNKKYLGFLGGTIYLKKTNILSSILGEHYYENGSYIYVIDKNKQVLYHPSQSRIGAYVNNNTGIEEIVTKKEGGMLLTNSNGIEMLAGYAEVPSTGWVVITQSPLESTQLPLTGIMMKVITRTLPMAFAVFLFIWIFARAISRPLQQLTDKAKLIDSPEVSKDIEKIDAWYVESLGLKRAILSGMKLLHRQIGQLQHDAKTDPLTNTSNRRAFQLRLEKQALLETPFSIVALDVDHFKHVNDSYGHSVGDEVLKRLGLIMTQCTKGDDMIARTGGEEFAILLSNTPLDNAVIFAENLRLTISEELFKTVGHITVSIGIAAWPNGSVSIDETLSLADNALYEAKDLGRNRCVVTR